jgi:signal transduction histidine kinase
MPVSKRFLSLVNFQLAQFADCRDVTSLVVYVTEASGSGEPDLVPVGHWPSASRTLPSMASDSDLRSPAERRRWLAMRQEGVLLGALLVETTELPWPEPLQQRLQAVSHCLTESLCLDLEHHQLQLRLHEQREQLKVLLHQLRNPLAALRTFGQLLLRRLENDPRNRPLVEGLLQEEDQLQRYVDAIDALERREPAFSPAGDTTPLLLPPSLGLGSEQSLDTLLQPLLQRATATAALQGRPWHGPAQLPQWQGDAGAVAEILANLLENAFRYSKPGAAVGLHAAPGQAGGWELCVWDGGEPITTEDRERIFEPGERGHSSADRPGTGLGLALARQLARHLGGELELAPGPASVAASLPEQGNAFRLRLPAGAAPHP